MLILTWIFLTSCGAQPQMPADGIQPDPPPLSEESLPSAPSTDEAPDESTKAPTETPAEPIPPILTDRQKRLQKLVDLGIPTPEEEFRGLWVAATDINAVLKNKNVEEAKLALDSLMDDCIRFRLNTVIFHVRVNSDAYYLSEIFPYANGVKSLLKSGFDILGYAVEAAHARGLDIQAWANPYQVGSDRSHAKCDDYFKYGSYYYYIPTSPAVQDLIVSGMREIIDRYDVDGLQYDDYFYTGGTVPEDEPAYFEAADYLEYTLSGGTLSVADWRREAVNLLIKRTYETAHSRQECVFGISPAYNIQKNYREKYADILLWMKDEGYIDYIMPQIYFGFENSTAPFAETTEQWVCYERLPSVKLYVGLAIYKTGMKKDDHAGEGKNEWYENNDIMAREVLCAREKNADGYCFFRHAYFTPDTVRDSGYSKDVAAAEIDALLKVLA